MTASVRAHTHSHVCPCTLTRTRTLTQTHSHSRAPNRRAHVRLREVARRSVVRVFGGGGGRRETPSGGTTRPSTYAATPIFAPRAGQCRHVCRGPPVASAAETARHDHERRVPCAGGWRWRSARRTAPGKGHRGPGLRGSTWVARGGTVLPDGQSVGAQQRTHLGRCPARAECRSAGARSGCPAAQGMAGALGARC